MQLLWMIPLGIFMYLLASSALLFCLNVREIKRAKPRDVAVLLILGAWVTGETPCDALQKRIEFAADYLQSHPKTIAIATGGCFHKGQTRSEARVIRDGLARAGIAPERILLEEQARITYENFYNCKQMLQEIQKEDASIGILTNRFHLLRTRLIAKHCGFGAAVLLAADSPKAVLGLYLRERLVIGEVLLRLIGLSKHGR